VSAWDVISIISWTRARCSADRWSVRPVTASRTVRLVRATAAPTRVRSTGLVQHSRQVWLRSGRAAFDSLFLSDGPVLYRDVGRRPCGYLEPLTLLTAVAMATERIGLIATASTMYNSPYNLARRPVFWVYRSPVSGGRAGWNVVTTATAEAARNFGLDELPSHDVRYEKAAEFPEVAFKLWDSWDDDAVRADKTAGVWAEWDRIHPPEHRGPNSAVHALVSSPSAALVEP
jgi:alkanesulfonate monooxygenase SsuD/methylene tetrahydromethanopterin reductase-like flavin-dependent oxidoreductase (luciferase family)